MDRRVIALVTLLLGGFASGASADDSMEARLRSTNGEEIEAYVRLKGNARRGALVFYKSAAACSKCHASGTEATPLGPNLATIGTETSVADIIESILDPSKKIRKGFETVSVVTKDGRLQTGLVARQDETHVVLRDSTNLLSEIVVNRSDIEEISDSTTSMMPQGLVASLRNEQEFYDLVRYISEIATGGPDRAAKLQPDPAELVVIDDTQDLDHASILRSLNQRDLNAGREIFEGYCVNCHGADGNTPKLPTARAFGSQRLKYGSDPYRMFMTVSRGAGLMAPLSHLSPKERYQVVHYVREAIMRDRNPDYVVIDDTYLDGLPRGSRLGAREEVGDRDFGPVLGSQLGTQVNNGLTFRLKDKVSVCYDLHRMRLAAAWQGGFLDLSETHHYRQRGERMPQISGEELPGLSHWAWELNGSFELPDVAKPPRGPIREDWLEYHGHYLHGNRALLSYAVHGREVLETVDAQKDQDRVSLIHTLQIGPGDHPLRLATAQLASTGGPNGLQSADSPTIRDFGVGESTSSDVAVITGQPARKDVPKSYANRPRYVVKGEKASQLDLGTVGRSIMVRFRSDESGTLVASAPPKGNWKPNGKSLFLRGGRLVYDIGWVGAITSKSLINDGRWHVAVLTVDNSRTRLYIDGHLEAEREKFRSDPVDSFDFKIGATSTDFGGDLNGEIDWIKIYNRIYPESEIANLGTPEQPPVEKPLFDWVPHKNDSIPAQDTTDWGLICVAKALDDIHGLSWSQDVSGRLILTIPPSDRLRQFRIVRSTLTDIDQLAAFHASATESEKQIPPPLESMRNGGPLRWPEVLEFAGTRGEPVNGYALDTIPVPFENPWNAWMRTSALDFFDDGRCVVTTYGGDVYLVSGIDDQLQSVCWKRFASGLFEPFGVRVVHETLYVTCRDGLKRLHDFNDDGEADFIEAFWNDDDVSNSFHAFNFDLQTDSLGNFYFAKAGQYTQHHRPGTVMRVPPEGHRADVVAWGLRTPNGMGRLWDDRFTVSDNQGPWMPAGKISLVRPGSFLGNMPINDEQTKWLKDRHDGQLPETFDEPIVWTPQELDSSSGGQVWAADERFGPLSNRLIHSSFGKGWLYAMSLQEVGDIMQGAIVALPYQWDAGVMRLRMNPADGQLYGTGLSGWQGPAGGLDGCLQRLRYAGGEVQMIDQVKVVPEGIELTLTFDIDSDSACDPTSYTAEMWNYLWSQQYGSDQFSVRNPGERGHDSLKIENVRKLSDRTVLLVIPDLTVCDQLLLRMNFRDAKQRPFAEQAYLTIHAIPD